MDKKKDLTYYLPKYFDTELKCNANFSENTIISYKYTFISFSRIWLSPLTL